MRFRAPGGPALSLPRGGLRPPTFRGEAMERASPEMRTAQEREAPSRPRSTASEIAP
jgi:hypothetical protein